MGKHLACWSSVGPEGSQCPASSFGRGRCGGLKVRCVGSKNVSAQTVARHRAPRSQSRSGPLLSCTYGVGEEADSPWGKLSWHTLWFVCGFCTTLCTALGVRCTSEQSSTACFCFWVTPQGLKENCTPGKSKKTLSTSDSPSHPPTHTLTHGHTAPLGTVHFLVL